MTGTNRGRRVTLTGITMLAAAREARRT
jgi:hypothetical protein